MIRFSNKSVFEQPSRTNCVRQPRFDCIIILYHSARSRILLSNQEQLRAKSALQSIFLRIQSTSIERASADAETDSSGSEAASLSDFDAH